MGELWILEDPQLRKFCNEGKIHIQSYWMDMAMHQFWGNAAEANDEFKDNMTELTTKYGMPIPALFYRFVMGVGIVPVVGVANTMHMADYAMSFRIPLAAQDAQQMDGMYDGAADY